jgi:hypothetical protein
MKRTERQSSILFSLCGSLLHKETSKLYKFGRRCNPLSAQSQWMSMPSGVECSPLAGRAL